MGAVAGLRAGGGLLLGAEGGVHCEELRGEVVDICFAAGVGAGWNGFHEEAAGLIVG